MGAHWDDIGFQGLDPRTDLNRSMKLLTILLVRITITIMIAII